MSLAVDEERVAAIGVVHALGVLEESEYCYVRLSTARVRLGYDPNDVLQRAACQCPENLFCLWAAGATLAKRN